MFCTSPIAIYKRGSAPPDLDPGTGLPMRSMVQCGKCRSCVSGRKNDWTGRLIAEASTAKDVYFLTLTYKDEPSDFRYSDIQLMLRMLRQHLNRNHGGIDVRFFCVGERGNLKGRIHWHILLFFNRSHKLSSPKMNTLWQFWPHGWTQVAHVSRGDTARRVRYCAKYAVKAIADGSSCRPRFSLKPAIGGDYVGGFASMAAEAGLPLSGFFTLPGMVWDRGARAGQHVKYRLRGAVARNACRIYCDAWSAKYDRPWPVSPFLARYRPEQLMERLLLWPQTRKDFDWALPDGHIPSVNLVRPVVKVGAPVYVYETQAEQEEREARERRNEEGEYRLEIGQARAERAAASERREKFCVGVGIDPEEPGVVEFIKSGCVGEIGEASRSIISAFILDYGDPGEVDRRSAPFYDGRSFDSSSRLFAQAKAAWADGLDVAEVVDLETGEVGYSPIKRKKYEPRVKDPLVAFAAPAYVRGGLAERAFCTHQGTVETRDETRDPSRRKENR